MLAEQAVSKAYPLASITRFGLGASSEGVLVDRENNVYGCSRNGVIYKVDESGRVKRLAQVEGGSANGLVMDLDGNLIYCDVNKKALIKVSQSGEISLFADQIAGVALDLPNFATYDAEGSLYVSNSSHRSRTQLAPELKKPEPNGSLLRIRKNGKGDVVARGLYLANGTAIDPKEEAVYVLQSLQNNCLRIEMKKDGSHGKPEVYAKDFPGMPDGMAFDRDGNLFVTICSGTPDKEGRRADMNKVLMVDPSGEWRTLLDDPAGEILSHPTNCAFGGPDLRDLFIASHSTDYFCRLRTDFSGHPLYHQRTASGSRS